METNTISFTSRTALQLWKSEITGQLSDGMWENTAPYDHWKFWCNLTPVLGTENKVETPFPYLCKKTGYNIAGLYEFIGDRMLKIGRMAKVNPTEDRLNMAEYMPDTLERWTEMHTSGKWDYEFVGPYMVSVTPEIAAAYYATTYTERDLRADVKVIKAAMKTMKR